MDILYDAYKKQFQPDTVIIDVKPDTADSKDNNANEMIAVMEQLAKAKKRYLN